jgi:hypothetical protein
VPNQKKQLTGPAAELQRPVPGGGLNPIESPLLQVIESVEAYTFFAVCSTIYTVHSTISIVVGQPSKRAVAQLLQETEGRGSHPS